MKRHAVTAISLTVIAISATACSSNQASTLTAEEVAERIDGAGIRCQADPAINHVRFLAEEDPESGEILNCDNFSILVNSPITPGLRTSPEDEDSCAEMISNFEQFIFDNNLANDTTPMTVVGNNWEEGRPLRGEPAPPDVLTAVAKALDGEALSYTEYAQWYLARLDCPPAEFR